MPRELGSSQRQEARNSKVYLIRMVTFTGSDVRSTSLIDSEGTSHLLRFDKECLVSRKVPLYVPSLHLSRTTSGSMRESGGYLIS